ncbi:MAG: copper resistance system multicopper oxidase [Gammaproteobacteria bacterium]|nr:copper resistance system multicopper oxidase [Gammaproteobacteria bacterium]
MFPFCTLSRRRPLATVMTLALALTAAPAIAKTYHLNIARTPVNITGTPTTAVTVNGQLPAPTLHWHEGEQVVIHVSNKLEVPTSLHWHGVLVPAAMDGVPGISFDAIEPGATFTYRFTVKQNGTYWYHAHSGGQEQKGLYGAIVITPEKPAPFQYDRDYAVVLSDWTDESPEQILANLKSQSDYYNYAKLTVGDFLDRVANQGLVAALSWRFMWSGMRMSPTDISDVTGAAYTFLMNGKTAEQNWTALYKPGERVRLRLINASSMTYFDVRIPGLKMTVVQADGQNVQPVTVDELRIAVAETYDVIVTPENGRAYTIFAQGMDRSGYARGTLAPGRGMTAPVPPMDPRPVLTMRAMGMAMHGMEGMPGMSPSPRPSPQPGEGEKMSGMHQHGMKMAASPPATTITPVFEPPLDTGVGVAHVAPMPRSRLEDPGIGLRHNGRVDLTYADLASLEPHPDPPPDRTIVLHLTGNMERYMWSFNGKTYAASVPLDLYYGERIRIVLINDTMMNHPIHLHGMFMELQNGHGVHNPLKHTINVKPGGKMSVLVTADAPGGWALHCHLLYHMESGMMRQVRVAPPPGSSGAVVLATPSFSEWEQPRSNMPPPAHMHATMQASSTHYKVMFDQLEYQAGGGDSPDAFAWEGQAWYGGDINKLWLKTEGTRIGGEAEDAGIEVLYDRAISSYFDFQAGVRHDFGQEPSRNWAAFGIQGLAPYFFDVELTGYLGPGGRTAARARAKYEWLFTQRLILEPELELNWYGKDDPARLIGSGLSNAALGLRLRYEFTRKFAPYIGVEYRRTFGNTSDYRLAAGERASDTEWLIGLRIWFN